MKISEVQEFLAKMNFNRVPKFPPMRSKVIPVNTADIRNSIVKKIEDTLIPLRQMRSFTITLGGYHNFNAFTVYLNKVDSKGTFSIKVTSNRNESRTSSVSLESIPSSGAVKFQFDSPIEASILIVELSVSYIEGGPAQIIMNGSYPKYGFWDVPLISSNREELIMGDPEELNKDTLSIIDESHITLLSCIYNSQELLEILLKSFYATQQPDKFKFQFIDSSKDNTSFRYLEDLGYPCIENTQNHLFKSLVEPYSHKGTMFSAYHGFAIQYLLDRVQTNYVVLVDCDVVFKQDIMPVFNEFVVSGAVVGGSMEYYGKNTPIQSRIHPCFMMLDMKQLRSLPLRFLDTNHFFNLDGTMNWDTGASLTQYCLPLGKVFYDKNATSVWGSKFDKYVHHIGHACHYKEITNKSFVDSVDRTKSEFLSTIPSSVKTLNIPRNEIKEDNYMDIEKELVIVSMTSWSKRLQNVGPVVMSILNGELQPDKIICNLSTDEFPGKENDLPNDLLLLQKYTIFEINWVKENTKAFKKIIPTIQNYFDKPEAMIISIDDDVIYPKDFIKKFVNTSKQYPEAYITYRDILIDLGVNGCTGCACLYRVKFFNETLWTGLTEEILDTNEDDWWYTLCLMKNGIKQISQDIVLRFFNEVEGMSVMGIYNTVRTENFYKKYL